MEVTINRDPFSRTETVREISGKGECAWCGNVGRLFRYGTKQDGVRPNRVQWHKGEFCSKSCHDSYHD